MSNMSKKWWLDFDLKHIEYKVSTLSEKTLIYFGFLVALKSYYWVQFTENMPIGGMAIVTFPEALKKVCWTCIPSRM